MSLIVSHFQMVFLFRKKSSTPLARLGPRTGVNSGCLARAIFLIVSNFLSKVLDFFSPIPGILQTASNKSLCCLMLGWDIGGGKLKGFLCFSAMNIWWMAWGTCSTLVRGKMTLEKSRTTFLWKFSKYCEDTSVRMKIQAVTSLGFFVFIFASFCNLITKLSTPQIMSPSA